MTNKSSRAKSSISCKSARDESMRNPEAYLTFKLYPYRHFILILYSVGAIMNNLSNYIFLPLQTKLAEIHNMEVYMVTFYTNYVNNFTYLPATFATNFIADNYGLYPSILIGGIVTLIGWWFIAFQDVSFSLLIVGMAITGLGAPFFAIPQKLSAQWYGQHERTVSTTAFNILYQMAASVGALVPQFFVPVDADISEADSDINEMLWATAVGCSIAFIPIVVFFRERPKTPPSRAADSKEKYDSWQSIKKLLKNKNYLLLLFSATLACGNAMSLIGDIQPILDALGINFYDVSYIVTIGNVVAIPGSVLIGMYVGKHQIYKKVLLWCNFLAVIMLALQITVGVWTFNPWLVCIPYAIYQILATSILPVSLEFLCEISFPAGEATSGGLLLMLVQLFSAIQGTALDAILGDGSVQTVKICYYIMIGTTFVAFAMLFCVKEDLRRVDYDESVVEDPRDLDDEVDLDHLGIEDHLMETDENGKVSVVFNTKKFEE